MPEPPESIDQIAEFERELRQNLARRPAPPSLKRRILEARTRHRTARFRNRIVLWQRLAASLLLAASLGGGYAWHHVQQQRKGEEARRQVFTALRITNRALNEMNARLAAHDRAAND